MEGFLLVDSETEELDFDIEDEDDLDPIGIPEEFLGFVAHKVDPIALRILYAVELAGTSRGFECETFEKGIPGVFEGFSEFTGRSVLPWVEKLILGGFLHVIRDDRGRYSVRLAVNWEMVCDSVHTIGIGFDYDPFNGAEFFCASVLKKFPGWVDCTSFHDRISLLRMGHVLGSSLFTRSVVEYVMSCKREEKIPNPKGFAEYVRNSDKVNGPRVKTWVNNAYRESDFSLEENGMVGE